MTVDEFEDLPVKPMHMDFGEQRVRYWRDWVEARRDGRLFPPGWEHYVGPNLQAPYDSDRDAPDRGGDRVTADLAIPSCPPAVLGQLGGVHTGSPGWGKE